jgi:hypothetical protein
MPRSNILFASFPRALFKNGSVYDPIAKQNVFVWDTDFEELRDYVLQFHAGTWPAPSPLGAPEPGTSSCAP